MILAANIQKLASNPALWEFASIVGGVASFTLLSIKFFTFVAKKFGWKDKQTLQVEAVKDDISSLSLQLTLVKKLVERSYELHETPLGEQPKWWCAARDGKCLQKVEDTKVSVDDLNDSILDVCANQKKIIRVLQMMLSQVERAKVELQDEWE